MPRKKITKRAQIVTGDLAKQVERNDYGDVAIGRMIGGVALAEPDSVPAAKRRAEDSRQFNGDSSK